MFWKIKSIKHTGTLGSRYEDRIDDIYPERIGRIVSFIPTDITVGQSFRIPYVKDANGAPMVFKALITSKVKSWAMNNDMFTVETKNSIYEFEYVDEEDV